jgi:hypothetical protein
VERKTGRVMSVCKGCVVIFQLSFSLLVAFLPACKRLQLPTDHSTYVYESNQQKKVEIAQEIERVHSFSWT